MTWRRMIGISKRLHRISCTCAISFLFLILLFCGHALAAEYGEINVTPANCAEWSTNLSSNVSNVAGDIIVNDGAVLEIENALVMMCRISSNNYPTIIVKNNGTLNINDSEITRGSTSGPCYSSYYGWRYENGSRGNVTNSTVTFCIQSEGFVIETNETVSLFNVTFDHGNHDHPSNCYAIYLNSASNASIRECTIQTSSASTSDLRRYTYGIYMHNSKLCNLSDNIIEEKSSDQHGIYILNSDNNTLINNSITRGTYSSTSCDAVHLESSFNNTLRDTRIAGSANHDGIYCGSSNNTTIINSTIDRADDYGIYIQSSQFCNLTDNNVADGADAGIYVQNADHATLLANNLTGNGDGIYLNSADDAALTGNSVNGSSRYGINITSSQNCSLRSNVLTNSTDYNLYVTENYNHDVDTSNTVNGGKVYYNYIDSGTITDTNIGHVTIVDCTNLWFDSCIIHNGDGIRIRGDSSNVSIRGGTIENNTVYGINLESTRYNNITSVNITDNLKQGVYLYNSSYNLINESIIRDNSNYGVYSEVLSSHNRIVENDIINNTQGGIGLHGSGYNNITTNNVSENRNDGGICIGKYHHGSASTQNTLHNNILLLNNNTGIGVYTNYNHLSKNNISAASGQHAFKVSYIRESYYNYIWRNNTANGEPINYYYNEHDTITELGNNIIESKYLSAQNVSNVGKITLVNCYNLTVRNNALSNNADYGSGIFLWNSDENTLFNNTISNNYDGIKLYNSSRNNITGLRTVGLENLYYGAYIEAESDYNNISESIIAGITYNGMRLDESDHTGITNTTISSVTSDGLYATGSPYTNLTNATIISTEADGVHMSGSHHVTITAESNITANTIGVRCTSSNHTDIINSTVTAGTDGIYMIESQQGNLTNNTIDATERGIFLTESRDHNITANNVTNYTITGILLLEYSTNNTMIGNDLTWDGTEFDIIINDSNDCVIANNESTAANYTFYLTGNTSLCTLDIVFKKTKVGYEDDSNLTLMWRIDVLCWDNYHKEAIMSNLTVRYSDLSDANGSLCWEGEISAEAGEGQQSGRLSGKLFDYCGPPTSIDNWLPIIEYKENVTGKTTYQPVNCTAISKWDVLYGKTRAYRNVTTTITEPGVTILVDTGYTPNGKCYYCHVDKYTFINTLHWTKYEKTVIEGTEYTPGRCVDCHDENDSIDIPHGNESGKDLLYNQSPQLCYTGRTGGLDCHSASAAIGLDQETEFNKTTHHPLGDGKLACKACHDNHGTDYDSDLLKEYYTSSTLLTYDSANFALCYVCHLEEKIVARMHESGGNPKSRHLQNYTNQTNLRDEYNVGWPGGFNGGLQNVHSPQTESKNTHIKYSCYDCHNPHGAVDPAMTRYKLNYTYITDLTPPGGYYKGVYYEDGDWANQTVLDQANWSNSTLNQGGGTWTRRHCGEGGFGCHGGGYPNGHGNLPNYFVYREFVNYTPAGGAGCLECHDNNASAYNTIPIRQIVNLTAIKLAMHTNLSGAFREPNGGDLQGTDKNFTEWLEYRNYTALQIANITEDNAICWACHSTNGTPPSPYYHPDRTMNPYKCPKCHGPIDGQPPHTQGLVAAIDNHGPTTKGAESILIQTDVGSGGSCGDCHVPSVLREGDIGTLEVWKWSGAGDGWITYQGRTIMGDVSHYGLNKTQGEDLNIDNPLCDTTDCLFCHCNWTNGQIWGNATNISGNMYGANTSNLSECYTYCHVRPDWVESVNESTLTHFHNKSIYAGGGPNCVLCHDVDSDYGVQSLVNSTAIAEGIHGNILNNTLVQEGYGMDNRSNPCWGCHQSDGTIPEGMGDRNGITDIDGNGVITVDELPYTCEDCHARSEAWSGATGDGHTWESASDPDLGMNRLPPVISDHYPNSALIKTNTNYGRCADCHNNSIDQDHGDTAYKILGHTIFSGVSHYGTTEDLLTPTKTCRYCHNDTANATLYGDATQNQHGNYTDEANTVDGCYSCHADNETPVDFHNMNVVSIPGDPDCLRCHCINGSAERRRIDETAYAGAIHARMNNATTGPNGINQSCWVCHFPEGVGMDEHNNRREPAYHCYDCHNKAGGPFSNVSDAPDVHNHFASGTSIEAYWNCATDSESCMGCHNKSEMMYAFNENDTYCTNFSITSHYGDNLTDLVDLYNETSYSNDYCAYCHQNGSTPFIERNKLKNINHHGSQTCDKCHGPGRLHNETLTRVSTDANCTNCHATYGNAQPGMKYKINVTAVNLGVHVDVNSNMNATAEAQTSDVNNSKCWGCHVPGGVCPDEGHKGTFNNDAYLCYECHNGTYAYENVNTATAVYNHFKTGVNITACAQADSNSESCGYGCHNLTSMKVPGFEELAGAEYRVNISQASHYTRNRADIATANLSDCTWCHRNATNEFIDIFERAGPPDYTGNISHAENLNSCITEDCHRSGRIHDSNLTIPTWSWGAECKNCHFGLTGSIYYVNETMFGASVHKTVNCTDCHIDESSSHPIEEYYWKWCECCHSYQADPIGESDRHNVTTTPSAYSVGGVNVLNITDCTICHDAATYNASVDYYTTYKCRYCHVYPDQGSRTSQEWY